MTEKEGPDRSRETRAFNRSRKTRAFGANPRFGQLCGRLRHLCLGNERPGSPSWSRLRHLCLGNQGPDRSRETRASSANPHFGQPAYGRLRHP